MKLSIDPWSADAHVVIKQLNTSTDSGLSSAEAASRLAELGPNTIESDRKYTWLRTLGNQFLSPFTNLLIAAACLSFIVTEWIDGIAILIVIVVNVAVGFLMEYQAERSVSLLQHLNTLYTRVLRDGKISEVSAEEIVPGDILFVESGDVVTADARIIKDVDVLADESALTGESMPVNKSAHKLNSKLSLPERKNMLYKGTYVVNGNCYAVTTHTGMSTELGKVAKLIQGAKAERTPLERKVETLTRKLIMITGLLLVVIFVAGMLNGHPLVQLIETSIALAVAAIPEGLPVVTTLALGYGVLRMSKQNVIVKRLSSVETLGATNVICTDKTGTLTLNKIEVAWLHLEGLSSAIQLDLPDKRIIFPDNDHISKTPAYHELLKISALCNNASFRYGHKSKSESGDPLEVALLKMVYCSHHGEKSPYLKYRKISEAPFSSETRLMITVHEADAERYVSAKGAAEDVIARCTSVVDETGIQPLTPQKRKQWIESAEKSASKGLKVLAFAYSNDNHENDGFQNLTLAALVGFIDPLRPGMKDVVTECRSAGINVVMMTGDHPATAKHIAMELGVMTKDDNIINGNTMKPYRELNANDKKNWLRTAVFARLSPEQKFDLVKLYQDTGMIVAVTGDGINDGPALKQAHIGIAMGLRGTQVAREMAGMILKDDAFTSIVHAIRQGRTIFDNIRKFVVLLLSCNMSELIVVATASILNLHFQLVPLQILFINLITDVLPALALGLTGAGPNIMQRKPYPANVSIIDRKRWKAIFIYAVVIALATISAVFTSHEIHVQENSGDACNNVLFYTLILSQLLNVFNMSFKKGIPFYKTEVFTNRFVWLAIGCCVALSAIPYFIPVLKQVLNLDIHFAYDWLIITGYSSCVVLVIQMLKRLRVVI